MKKSPICQGCKRERRVRFFTFEIPNSIGKTATSQNKLCSDCIDTLKRMLGLTTA